MINFSSLNLRLYEGNKVHQNDPAIQKSSPLFNLLYGMLFFLLPSETRGSGEVYNELSSSVARKSFGNHIPVILNVVGKFVRLNGTKTCC